MIYKNMKTVPKNYTIVETTFFCVILLVSMLLVDTNSAMAAGALASVFVKPSNNIVNTVATYEITFNTAITGTIKTITLAFPSGYNTFGAKLIERSGVGAGTVALGPTTITYSVTSPITVPANTPIRLEFSNINNPGVAGNYAVAITTKDSSAVVIDGPTASTAIPIKQIGTKDMANGAVTNSKLAANSVSSNNIADSSVTLSKLGSDVPFHIDTEDVSQAINSVAPGESVGLSVKCPTGSAATGGGFSTNPLAPVGVSLDHGYHNAAGNMVWQVNITNTNAFNVQFVVTAMCSKLVP
jgi:hypothetical protein